LSCEEKRTRKGAGNVTKNAKALLVKIREIMWRRNLSVSAEYLLIA